MTTLGRGGVLFRVGDALHFMPASVAMKVMPTPEVARIPGAPPELRGVALVDGKLIPVVDVLGDQTPSTRERTGWQATRGGAMLVCAIMGECVGLVGIHVVATGRFDVGPSGEVRFDEEGARTFDVAEIIARVRQGRWAV